MELLVIGKNGQVASALRERAGQWPEINATFIGRPELDLENVDAIVPALEQQKADVIVNAAAWTDVDGAEDEADRAEAVNAVAPGKIAEAARRIGAKLIHISTDYVFDGTKQTAYTEDDPTAPINTYGRTKLAGEEAVRRVLDNHLILRTAWVYSPFGRNFVKTMLRLAATRDTISVVDDQYGNPTSAHDIAAVILKIAESWRQGGKSGLGETLHCAASGDTSWAGFARHIFAVSREAGGPYAEVKPISAADWPTKAKRPGNSRLDCSRLKEQFGFVLPNWQRSAVLVVSQMLNSEVPVAFCDNDKEQA